jgi:hypothetical protein
MINIFYVVGHVVRQNKFHVHFSHPRVRVAGAAAGLADEHS